MVPLHCILGYGPYLYLQHFRQGRALSHSSILYKLNACMQASINTRQARFLCISGAFNNNNQLLDVEMVSNGARSSMMPMSNSDITFCQIAFYHLNYDSFQLNLCH